MQFRRRVRVTVGPPGGIGTVVDDRFRVAFTVRKDDTQDANRAEVSIYGLNSDTRTRLLSTDNVMTIEAGYEGALEVLATGNVSAYRVQSDNPEVITILEAGDGLRTLRDARVSLSFEEGVSFQTVLDGITAQMNVGFRDTGTQLVGLYRNGFSFTGKAKEALNKVTARAGVSWSIQNDELQLVTRGGVAIRRAVRLTPQTGLIGSPQTLDDLDFVGEDGENTGYRVRCQLQPKIEPGGLIEIDSRDVSGQWRVKNVQHSGDTRASEWITTAEVVE